MKRTSGNVRPTVLILSNERDASVDWVVRELRRRSAGYLRLNTERLADYSLTVNPVSLRWQLDVRGIPYLLDEVRSVWYRRPESPTNHIVEGLSPSEQDLVADQWRAVVRSLRSLPQADWMNDPFRNMAAESKIEQLRQAKSHGFEVPKTIVTNSRLVSTQFLDCSSHGIVLKALHAPLINHPESPSFVYTKRVDRAALMSMATVETAPFILQEEIRPKRDVRVTVVDSGVYAAIADISQGVDWRAQDGVIRFAPHELPTKIRDRCVQMLKALGLRFGAFDFVLDDGGTYYFLEVNPNGEWGWLQKTCGLPIAEAITEVLLSETQ